MQLLTIPFSHFCEKARWGLDRAGLSYRELKFAPVAQRFAAMPLGSTTVPVLVEGRTVIRESTEILQRADRELPADERLFPADPAHNAEVHELVERFDLGVAPEIRRWFYAWTLQDESRLKKYACAGLPGPQRLFMQAGMPVIAKLLKQHFRIKSDTMQRTADAVGEEIGFVSERLSDGRPYLTGDRFTAADLTFAAFVGAVMEAPEYGGSGYSPPAAPEELRGDVAEWVRSPAGDLVRRVYREHR